MFPSSARLSGSGQESPIDHAAELAAAREARSISERALTEAVERRQEMRAVTARLSELRAGLERGQR